MTPPTATTLKLPRLMDDEELVLSSGGKAKAVQVDHSPGNHICFKLPPNILAAVF
jgi:hypothetical protein